MVAPVAKFGTREQLRPVHPHELPRYALVLCQLGIADRDKGMSARALTIDQELLATRRQLEACTVRPT